MEDFYVTLPSNVPNGPFNNTTSRYVTRLPEVLQLKRDEWMVALTDLVYPHSFSNVGRPLHYWIHFKSGEPPVEVTFPAAQYSNLEHVINTLNNTANPTRMKRGAVDDYIQRAKRTVPEKDDEEDDEADPAGKAMADAFNIGVAGGGDDDEEDEDEQKRKEEEKKRKEAERQEQIRKEEEERQRQEQARQEQARQEEERQRQEQQRQELARQEQARQEAERQRQEQARQEQARQEQARQEQVRQEQARQEQARQEQARQEEERQRQEEKRKEAEKKDTPKGTEEEEDTTGMVASINNPIDEEEESDKEDITTDGKAMADAANTQVFDEEESDKEDITKEGKAMVDAANTQGAEDSDSDIDENPSATVTSMLTAANTKQDEDEDEEPPVLTAAQQSLIDIANNRNEVLELLPGYREIAMEVSKMPGDRTVYAELLKTLEGYTSRVKTEIDGFVTKRLVQFSEQDGRVKIDIKSNDILFLEFDKACSYFLGFTDTIVRDTQVAPHGVDFFGDVSVIYLYSDVVEPIIVGDQKSNLLSVIPCTGKHGNVVHYSVPNPRYVPIISSTIDNIRIELLTDGGEPIPFGWGTSVVVLHFKKMK